MEKGRKLSKQYAGDYSKGTKNKAKGFVSLGKCESEDG